MKVTKRIQSTINYVSDQIDRGVLPEEVRPFVKAARKGQYDTIRAFQAYEHKKEHRSAIAENWLIRELQGPRFSALPVIARPSPSSDETIMVYEDPAVPREEEEEPRTSDQLTATLKKRIQNIHRPQEMTPEKWSEQLLSGLGFAAGAKMREAKKKVDKGLARKMAATILAATRQNRRLHMLPRPKFDNPNDPKSYFTSAINGREDVMQEWRQWSGWRMVLTNIFAAYLAEGTLQQPFPSLVAQRKAEIAHMHAWHEDIKAKGMSPADVEKAINRMYWEDKADERARAVANYVAMESSVRGEMEYDGVAVKRLYWEILALHRADPLLGPGIMDLAAHFVHPLTYANVMQLLKRRDVQLDSMERFTLQNMLEWHTFPLGSLAGRLATHISKNDRSTCPDIGSFCEKKLGFRRGMFSISGAPEPFMAKLTQMAQAGVDLSRLLAALDEKFPGAIAPQKAEELAKIAAEKRIGALPLKIDKPKRRSPAAKAPAKAEAQAATVRTRGNGPRKLKRRGTTGGTQLSLNFTAKYRMDGGIGNYMIAGRRLPMFPGPRTMMNMGLNLMHLKNI
ncbi:MAG: hypothetical protein WC683_13280 [bacterium]